MKTPQAAIRKLQDELNHLYQIIYFRDGKYKESMQEWKDSEAGVLYLEHTIQLGLKAIALQKKMKNIESSLLNPFI